MNYEQILSQEFSMKQEHIKNIISLIDEGSTIPFIARYRKELTGSCDDQVLREVADRLIYLRNLDKRKGEVERGIKEQDKWTEEIEKALIQAKTMPEVEDIYRPYKQKRKTRASMAIAKGLQPLADVIFAQMENIDLNELASKYIDSEKGVESAEDALKGAKDIIAEMISDNAEIRKTLRQTIINYGKIECVLDSSKEESKTFETYKDFSQSIKQLPPHRILAMNRGENLGVLKVKLIVDSKFPIVNISKQFKKENQSTAQIMQEIIEDSYERLLFPSLENAQRTELTDFASEQAIKMFESNLKPLLLQPPLKGKVILGLDPAYRTGCKIAVIDESGTVLDTTVIYPTPPQSKVVEAEAKLKELIEKHKVDVISIGNGTASKESEIFVAELIPKLKRKVMYAIVNEAGASVYSASKLGAEEFPEYDVALRSAASIARRLQDPLAELIKIDVKSIGVGQYQHDMPVKRLDTVLGGVVEDCVNSVGVDINTASPSLLSYVSGLNSKVAKNIVAHRESIKEFKSRTELKKVAGLGPKAYEQCAGFLRVVNGKNIMDNTSVHPESYDAARKLLSIFKLKETDVAENKIFELPKLVEQKGEENVARECGVGVPTLQDIVQELLRPGRDIRESLPQTVLRSDIMSMEDLKEGMILNGTVRNVIDFGAFIDIGVHQDGLVHISQICDEFIKHPSEKLKVGDLVQVKILAVDVNKKRISLTMKLENS